MAIKPKDPNAKPRKSASRSKPVTQMFKLRDPVTGLFLASNTWAYRPATFAKNGKHWSSRKGAEQNYIEYRIRNATHGYNTQELELVEYSLSPVEVGSEVIACNAVETLAAYQVMFGQHDYISVAIRRQIKGGNFEYPFTHIIQVDDQVDVAPFKHVNMRIHTITFDSYSSSPPKTYIFVKDSKSLLFLKMALQDDLVAIHANDDILAQAKVKLSEMRSRQLEELTID